MSRPEKYVNIIYHRWNLKKRNVYQKFHRPKGNLGKGSYKKVT